MQLVVILLLTADSVTIQQLAEMITILHSTPKSLISFERIVNCYAAPSTGFQFHKSAITDKKPATSKTETINFGIIMIDNICRESLRAGEKKQKQ